MLSRTLRWACVFALSGAITAAVLVALVGREVFPADYVLADDTADAPWILAARTLALYPLYRLPVILLDSVMIAILAPRVSARVVVSLAVLVPVAYEFAIAPRSDLSWVAPFAWMLRTGSVVEVGRRFVVIADAAIHLVPPMAGGAVASLWAVSREDSPSVERVGS